MSQPEKRYADDQLIWRKNRSKGGTFTENMTSIFRHVTPIYNTFSHFNQLFKKIIFTL